MTEASEPKDQTFEGEYNRAMKLIVDQSMCQGHGRCMDVVPLDDNGYAAVPELEIAHDSEELALSVVRGCPERAITVAP